MDFQDQQVRLIVSDVDGTLLDQANRIPTEAYQAIQSARERGIRFTLASGRGWPSLKQIADYLALDDPVIAAGGGALVDPQTGRLLAADRLPWTVVCDLVSLARRHQISGLNGITADRVFMEVNDENWARMLRKGLNLGPQPHPDWRSSLYRTQDILADLPETPFKLDLYGFRDDGRQLIQDVMDLSQQIEMCVFSGRIEITHRGATKGARLAELARKVDIPRENILAIGDDVNDLSLFDACGIKIAMGNACPALKQSADFVAPGNDQNGFTWAIRRLALEEKNP